MKKTFRIFGLFCIAMSFLTFAACGTDDDGDVTPPGDDDEEVIEPSEPSDPSDDDDAATSTWLEEFQKKTGKRLTSVGNIKFSYDEQGRCTNFKGDYKYAIDWDNKSIAYNVISHNVALNFKTNNKGFITAMWGEMGEYHGYNTTYYAESSYDKEDHLIRIIQNFDYKQNTGSHKYKEIWTDSLTWQNGNLVAVTREVMSDRYGEMALYTNYETTISYNTQINKYRQCCLFISRFIIDWYNSVLSYLGMFGVGTVNFPTEFTMVFSDTNSVLDTLTRTASFTIDKNGLISSETIDNFYFNDYIYEDIH